MKMSEWLKNIRKYANFFEAPTKYQKELSVSEEWLNTIGNKLGYDERTLVAVNDQWPDCEINLKSGELCGIEVTELVDGECVKRNEKGENVYRRWDNDDFINEVEVRLRNKNTKSHGGKYHKLVVIIHTDEFELTYDDFNEVIERHKFTGLNNIDEAYIVYSYVPAYKKYPVSVVNI